MTILIQPSDMIKRCLWTEFKRFTLKDMSEEEIEKLVIEDKPMTITEEDAYVCGLLRIVETPNLIHRFNIDMVEMLKDKSFIDEDELLINKSILLRETVSFKDRFPHYFNATKQYEEAIKDLIEHINKKYVKFDELKTFVVQKRDKKITVVYANDAKKLMNFVSM